MQKSNSASTLQEGFSLSCERIQTFPYIYIHGHLECALKSKWKKKDTQKIKHYEEKFPRSEVLKKKHLFSYSLLVRLASDFQPWHEAEGAVDKKPLVPVC